MSKGPAATGPSVTGPVAPASALQAQPEKPQHYTVCVALGLCREREGHLSDPRRDSYKERFQNKERLNNRAKAGMTCVGRQLRD
ncbi:UNVERIFIED_CONTAM: hypothetical protein K2H54_014497 [Gekko kuhli]